MDEVVAVSKPLELAPSNTETLIEGPMSAESAAPTEPSDDLRLHVALLETELTDQSEKIRAYRAFLSLAIGTYWLFLLLGPGLDMLTSHKLPDLKPYQYLLIIEPPCMWLLSMWLLNPSKARRHS